MLGGHGVDGGVALLAVVGRIDILATRDEEAIKVSQQVGNIGNRRVARDCNHDRTGFGHRRTQITLDRDQHRIGELEGDSNAGAAGHRGTLSHEGVGCSNRHAWGDYIDIGTQCDLARPSIDERLADGKGPRRIDAVLETTGLARTVD